jgi:hypothetical protein
MRKIYFFLLFVAVSLVLHANPKVHVAIKHKGIDVKAVIKKANALQEQDYAIPSWTLFKEALTKITATPNEVNARALQRAVAGLKSKQTPFNVNMTFHGDPTHSMGFDWITNQGIAKGTVELVKGKAMTTSAFARPDFSFPADTTNYTVNYCVKENGLLEAAGIADNSKRSYTSHKALAAGLEPNTTYSFRVGVEGAWSEIGSFTTAKEGKDAFSFIYFTDPQANTADMFNTSRKTLHAARKMYPADNFALTCGDLVETHGTNNAEWEYEQFFATQQDIWYSTPLAPIMGNHDITTNRNFTRHFNTEPTAFDQRMAKVPGSVYSFVYGDALFLAMDYENYKDAAYLDSLAYWVKNQVAAHPDVKWKIAFYHKSMYTGAEHQKDKDGKLVREKFTPLFDSLKIDLAIQGHDHVYEVIGPLKNKALVPDAVSGQTVSTPTVRDNLTGKWGGRYNVKEGTLYFLNNSAGKKKYEPLSKQAMTEQEASIGMNNYFSLFTGRFGQTGEPTFSHISVSSSSIDIETYTVDDNGLPSLFDKFSIVKE